MIVLAGDIGGTNSRLALFRDRASIFDRVYPSADHDSLDTVVARFLDDATRALGPDAARPERGCLGIAGPVENDTSRITNLPWFVDARHLEASTKIAHIGLLNDFQAAATGVTVLGPEHLLQLGGGAKQPNGPMVVLGAGTGLGQAFLFWSQADQRYMVVASEGGHADFHPRTGLETGLLNYLIGKYGRVSHERVLSGQGLVDIFGFLSNEPALRPLVSEETRGLMVTDDPAAVVSRQALAGRDAVCSVALNLFCSVYGSLSGNLALTFLATGGVYLAGGIAGKVRPFLENGVFREAFEAKGRFQSLVAKIPAYVVRHPDVGLLGAAVAAERL